VRFRVLRPSAGLPQGVTDQKRADRSAALRHHRGGWSQEFITTGRAPGDGGRASACVRLCPGWCLRISALPTSPRVALALATHQPPLRWMANLRRRNHLLLATPGHWPLRCEPSGHPGRALELDRCERSTQGNGREGQALPVSIGPERRRQTVWPSSNPSRRKDCNAFRRRMVVRSNANRALRWGFVSWMAATRATTSLLVTGGSQTMR